MKEEKVRYGACCFGFQPNCIGSTNFTSQIVNSTAALETQTFVYVDFPLAIRRCNRHRIHASVKSCYKSIPLQALGSSGIGMIFA